LEGIKFCTGVFTAGAGYLSRFYLLFNG